MSNQTTVSDLFRRALEIRQSRCRIGSFADIEEKLTVEFDGKPFPSPAFLTIPELRQYRAARRLDSRISHRSARHSNRKLDGSRAGNYHQFGTGRKLPEGIGQRRRARKRMAQPSQRHRRRRSEKYGKMDAGRFDEYGETLGQTIKSSVKVSHE